MISVKEAEKLIFESFFKAEILSLPLEKAVEAVLAKEIKADRPFPPFNRVALDGIAISSGSFKNEGQFYPREKTHFAGQEQTELIDSNACIEIMTGSILPLNCDAVIPYEELDESEKGFAIKRNSVVKGQNVHGLGSDNEQGDILVEKGSIINSSIVGIAASVGLNSLDVYNPPKIALISTGDEIIPIDHSPEPHQIRMSNSISIASSLHRMGFQSKSFHLSDARNSLKSSLNDISSEFPICILIGGASKGKADHASDVIQELGFQKSFHGVSQRPGKPFWMARKGDSTVFGFPGNPVSCFVCFYRYVKPWLFQGLGHSIPKINIQLGEDFNFKKPLSYFLQVKLDNNTIAQPKKGSGSGDLTNLAKADGFLELDGDRDEFKKGEEFPFLPFG